MVFFMRISLHVNRPSTWRGVPARSNASSSATQSDELNKLNRRSSRSSGFLEDPARLDLFSKSRFTKHCKWARDDSVETQFRRLARFSGPASIQPGSITTQPRVSSAGAPKTWHDILNPRWKGSISL
jgi:hypothetical protein